MKLPEHIAFCIERLEGLGYETYCVGGCVRDTMLGRVPNDFDVTTSALPEETLRVFENERTIPTGLKHGTVTVILKDCTPVEVTTYRIDGRYTDSRHPESVSFTDRIEDDLARRDFTVNAMAYNKKRGHVDPFDGQGDLRRGLLRAVGEADKRMAEDALRIMRAFRFSAQLAFSIDKETKKALISQRDGLKNVSGERMGVELSKLVCAPNAKEALEGMAQCGVSELIFGEYAPENQLLCALEKLSPAPEVKLGCLLYSCGIEAARKILNAMKYSNALKNSVLNIIQTKEFYVPQNDADVRRFLLRFGKDADFAAELMRVLRGAECLSEDNIRRIKKDGFCPSIQSLALGGNDLLKLGIAGKEIGQTLSYLLDAVTEDPTVNTAEKLTELITKNRATNA